MIFPLLRLELRQNVLSAASVVIAFLITLPIARLVSAATGLETAKALEAILSAWILIGLPLAAALIGASAGVRAASPSARECEALLPGAPPCPWERPSFFFSHSPSLCSPRPKYLLPDSAMSLDRFGTA